MNEKPLERLNYYNGQRLEASDLKTEQEYHIRTRRWLNKSLYSAGIARGLEVRAVPEVPSVVVSSGLALDNEGREIILLGEETVEVCSFSGTDESTVVGNYLVIEYAEEAIAYEKGGCAARTEGKGASKSTAPMGGPSRIRSTVKFSWVPFVPHPGSNQVVLAQVELDGKCESVYQIDPSERHYIGAASAAKVRQYALEGERHIDANNPGRIYFHIRGRQPNAVTLYLRAEQFSTLFYTELGKHNHSNSASGFSVPIPAHSHTIDPIVTSGVGSGTSPAGGHTPSHRSIQAKTTEQSLIPIAGYALFLSPLVSAPPVLFAVNHVSTRLDTNIDMQISFEPILPHIHEIPTSTQPDPAKTIPLSGSGSSSSAGVSDVSARIDSQTNPEEALTFVNDLQVFIGENIAGLKNKTSDILNQLQDAQPSVTWSQLGNGNSNHILTEEGTGAIRLDFLPDICFFEDREYLIELRVASGGGRVLYNLYIE